MNSNTIREVLIKILSINKGLTEDTLNKLLVASGWDNNDVQEGMKIFKELNAGVKVTPTPPVIEKKIEPVIVKQEVKMEPPAVNVAPAPQPEVHVAAAIVPPAPVAPVVTNPTPVQIASNPQMQQQASLDSIKEKLASLHVGQDTHTPGMATNVAPVAAHAEVKSAPILRDDHSDEEKGNTPWGFILFDIFLFLVALGFLIFIFIK